MENKEKILHRVVTFLDRQELDFLDKITKDILFSTGMKIPRSTILKELIDIFLSSSARVHTRSSQYKGLVELLTQRVTDEKRGRNDA